MVSFGADAICVRETPEEPGPLLVVGRRLVDAPGEQVNRLLQVAEDGPPEPVGHTLPYRLLVPHDQCLSQPRPRGDAPGIVLRQCLYGFLEQFQGVRQIGRVPEFVLAAQLEVPEVSAHSGYHICVLGEELERCRASRDDVG